MNELMTLVREVGGGLAGVVIVVQGWANWIQYKRNGELQDKMLEMAQAMVKESRDLVTETNKTNAASTEIMGRAVRLLEDRRSETRLLEDRR
jgi:hypothetical protein